MNIWSKILKSPLVWVGITSVMTGFFLRQAHVISGQEKFVFVIVGFGLFGVGLMRMSPEVNKQS